MNMHIRVVGALHILAGALALSLLIVLYWFFSSVLDLFSVSTENARVFAGLISVVAIPIALIGLCQVSAAVLMLCGVRWARAFVIAFGVLGMVNIPIGSLLGMYTLWALLLSERAAVREQRDALAELPV
jgi:hypothetical protein